MKSKDKITDFLSKNKGVSVIRTFDIGKDHYMIWKKIKKKKKTRAIIKFTINRTSILVFAIVFFTKTPEGIEVFHCIWIPLLNILCCLCCKVAKL